MKGPYGDSETMIGPSPGQGVGNGGAICATSEHKELAAKYLDLYYSESGQTLFSWGVYGDTYVEEGGVKKLTDKWANHETLSRDEYHWNYVSPSWIGPGIRTQEARIAKKGAGAEIQLNSWTMNYNIMTPPLALTDEEKLTVQEIMPDVTTLAAETTTGIITGQKTFDDYKDALNTFDQVGIDKALDCYKAAFDRYKEKAEELGVTV
jgi:ABC-type glycerol-3-phosphate transport system substrate-binding protein